MKNSLPTLLNRIACFFGRHTWRRVPHQKPHKGFHVCVHCDASKPFVDLTCNC
jgi:hypothetical protein